MWRASIYLVQKLEHLALKFFETRQNEGLLVQVIRIAVDFPKTVFDGFQPGRPSEILELGRRRRGVGIVGDQILLDEFRDSFESRTIDVQRVDLPRQPILRSEMSIFGDTGNEFADGPEQKDPSKERRRRHELLPPVDVSHLKQFKKIFSDGDGGSRETIKENR